MSARPRRPEKIALADPRPEVSLHELGRRKDPFEGLSCAEIASVLARRGWLGVVEGGPSGLRLDLDATHGRLVLLVTDGAGGERNLEKLEGAHGTLPLGPYWIERDGTRRVARIYRTPVAVADAPSLHGVVAGVHLRAHGLHEIPSGAGHPWPQNRHPVFYDVPELPRWAVDAAKDPATTKQVWGTVTRDKGSVRVLAEWESALTRSRGRVLNTHGNLCKILRGSPEFAGRFRLNEMSQAVEFEGRVLPEGRVGQIREKIEDNGEWGGFSPSESATYAAIRTVAEEHRYHPVQEYLQGLRWDGEPRLERVATEVLHAKDAPLLQETVRRWFISAVARALDPGCQVDTALVLLSPEQGLRKSSFFRELAHPWFGDTEVRIGEKDGYGQIHANWITEWGEIDRITSASHAGAVKAFISRRRDDFRPPYGRTTQSFPRSCVLVASANPKEILVDPTGARRFWVLEIAARIELETVTAWRDQLWAEAVAAYRAGERWHFEPDEERQHAEHVETFRRRDVWEEIIGAWLDAKWAEVKASKQLTHLTTGLILEYALNLQPRDMDGRAQGRVANAMSVLGYTTQQARVQRGELGLYRKPNGETLTRVNAWVRVGASEPEPEPLSDPDEVPF